MLPFAASGGGAQAAGLGTPTLRLQSPQCCVAGESGVTTLPSRRAVARIQYDLRPVRPSVGKAGLVRGARSLTGGTSRDGLCRLSPRARPCSRCPEQLQERAPRKAPGSEALRSHQGAGSDGRRVT